MKRRLPLVILSLLWPALAPACGLAGAESRTIDDELVVYYRLRPARPEVSQQFGIEMRFCRGGEKTRIDGFRIDASMPAHNHGMNYRPAVDEGNDGLLRISGMLFHMPGLWRIDVDFVHAERRQRLSLEYPL